MYVQGKVPYGKVSRNNALESSMDCTSGSSLVANFGKRQTFAKHEAMHHFIDEALFSAFLLFEDAGCMYHRSPRNSYGNFYYFNLTVL